MFSRVGDWETRRWGVTVARSYLNPCITSFLPFLFCLGVDVCRADEAAAIRLTPNQSRDIKVPYQGDHTQWTLHVDPCLGKADDRVGAGIEVRDESGRAIVFEIKEVAVRALWTLRWPDGAYPVPSPTPRPKAWIDNGQYQHPHVVPFSATGYPVRLALNSRGEATRLRLYVEYFDRAIVDVMLSKTFRPQSAKVFSKSKVVTENVSDFSGLTISVPREGEMSHAEVLLEAINPDHPAMTDIIGATSDVQAIAATLHYFRTRSTPSGPPLSAPALHPAWQEIADAALANKYGSTLGFFTGFDKQWTDAKGSTHPFVTEDETLNWARDPGHLTRHFHWLSLAKAYEQNGDARYVDRFAHEVTDWVNREPFYWPANPEIGGLNWMDGTMFVHGYMNTSNIGRRLELTWWPAWEVFRKSEQLSTDAHLAFLVGSIRQARLLMNPTSFAVHDDGGAHGAIALLQTALLLPELKESAAWKDEADRRWNAVMRTQFHPDGSHVSLSTGYNWASILALENYISVMRRADETVAENYLNQLENSYRHPMLLARSDRGQIDLNDGGWGKIADHMQRALELFPERDDFQWFATDGKSGNPPRESSVYFPDAGHFVLRTGWKPDARYLFMDAGPVGASHGKEDKLNVYVAIGEHQLISSGGRGAYSGGPFSAYTGSTRGYNTVLVDDGVQSRIPPRKEIMSDDSSAREFKSTQAFDLAKGSFVHGWHGARGHTKGEHQRTIVLVKGDNPPSTSYYVVFDRLTFADKHPHHAKALFHLRRNHAGIVDENSKIVHGWDAGASVRIMPARPDAVDVNIIRAQTEPHIQGWHVVGTAKAPMNTPAFQWNVTGEDTQAWVIVPAGFDQRWCVKSVKSDWVDGELVVTCSTASGHNDVVTQSGLLVERDH